MLSRLGPAVDLFFVEMRIVPFISTVRVQHRTPLSWVWKAQNCRKLADFRISAGEFVVQADGQVGPISRVVRSCHVKSPWVFFAESMMQLLMA